MERGKSMYSVELKEVILFLFDVMKVNGIETRHFNRYEL